MVNHQQNEHHHSHSVKNDELTSSPSSSPTPGSNCIMKKKSISGRKKRKKPSVNQRSLIRQISNQGGSGNLKRCSSDLLLEKIKHYEVIDKKTARKNSLTQYLESNPHHDPNDQRHQRRSSSLCRVTGPSFSMDEPHYFPMKNDFPLFDRRSSCHITMKHDVLGDNFHFPVANQAGMATGTEDPILSYGRIPQDVQQAKRQKLRNDRDENPSQLLRARFKEKKRSTDDVYGEKTTTTITNNECDDRIRNTCDTKKEQNQPNQRSQSLELDVNNNPIDKNEDNVA